jgi:hypothetical protein
MDGRVNSCKQFQPGYTEPERAEQLLFKQKVRAEQNEKTAPLPGCDRLIAQLFHS